MRVNVYSQEQTGNVDLVIKIGAENEAYSAIFFSLMSSDRLHSDDQSGVTFWLPESPDRREGMAQMFDRAAKLVRAAAPEVTA